jgi:hypothetical protein
MDGQLDRNELTPAQRSALSFAESTARGREADVRRRLGIILLESGCEPETLDAALASITSHARIVLHFHPDRFGTKPVTVVESLMEDGRYRSQFETGLSSGSRSAFAGGSRDRWERELFGGSYHDLSVSAEERPKYGSLELIRHADGPAPRFGSCYFVLHQSVVERSTFTFGGSEAPLAIERFGTIDNLQSVIAPLLAEIADGGFTPVKWPPFRAPTLGVAGLTVRDFLGRLASELPAQRPDPSLGPPGRVLDSGVEAHVHGSIDLRRDVERLVVDPSFDGTSTGELLSQVCRRYDIVLERHCGFVMRVEDVPEDFRGPAMKPLARRIAPQGTLDARVIGAADASLHQRPEQWADWGTKDETLQHLKQLWHVLVHHGVPTRESGELAEP